MKYRRKTDMTGVRDPFAEVTYIPFTWSQRSAKQNYLEYNTVITALKNSVHSPNAQPEDRRVIVELLRGPNLKPLRMPRTCWMTDAQWYSVSRALRDWQTEPVTQPMAYAYCIKARGLSPEDKYSE